MRRFPPGAFHEELLTPIAGLRARPEEAGLNPAETDPAGGRSHAVAVPDRRTGRGS
ncbi:hypothetical protein AB0B54_02560 [Microbispora bryophytorum]|uniref:hypothetical protein n=1 Tax=Microbispora bryophytorum TaxID=1460882 RepID=UPI0033F54DB2